MFDCPDASHTSPRSTFVTVSSFEALNFMVYGPPALSVFTFVLHLPNGSVVTFVVLLFQLVVMETFSPGLAHPQSATLDFCCSTRLLDIKAGSFICAKVVDTDRMNTRITMVMERSIWRRCLLLTR